MFSMTDAARYVLGGTNFGNEAVFRKILDSKDPDEEDCCYTCMDINKLEPCFDCVENIRCCSKECQRLLPPVHQATLCMGERCASFSCGLRSCALQSREQGKHATVSECNHPDQRARHMLCDKCRVKLCRE